MKALVFNTPVNNAVELIGRIAVASEEIRGMPEVFQNVWISMRQRCDVLIVADGRKIEYLL